MRLVRIRIVRLGPFEDIVIPISVGDGEPRSMTVVWGGGGVGKTTLLHAIAGTRPGHATVLQPTLDTTSSDRGFAVADWRLDDEDPSRPHPLRLASPNATLDEEEDVARLRRREASLFDKQASEDGGFAFVAISGLRWFSRQAVALSAPTRTVLRYDVKGSSPLDDASRSDLTREVKQALAYCAISGALAAQQRAEVPAEPSPMAAAARAMHTAVDTLARIAGFAYEGVDAVTLEPTFLSPHGELVPFDLLPSCVRHLVCFAALPVRALYAAFRDQDPRTAQGVVAIDDAATHLDAGMQRALPSALRRILPRVQWILTTTSPDLALGCESSAEVLALRRMPSSPAVELFQGDEATLH